MNEVFSISRFFRYAAKRYNESWKRYLFFVALAAAMLVMLLLVRVLAKDFRTDDLAVTWIFLMPPLVSALIANTDMKPLRSRHSCQIAGTLPCSRTESYLFILLNSTLATAVAMAAVFCFFIGIAPYVFGLGDPIGAYLSMGDWENFTPLLFCIVNALVIFAGTLRIRNHLLAVIVTNYTVGQIGILVFLLPGIVNLMLPDPTHFSAGFTYIYTQVASGDTTLSFYTRELFLSENALFAVNFWSWTALLWVMGYFNFRQRQIS